MKDNTILPHGDQILSKEPTLGKHVMWHVHEDQGKLIPRIVKDLQPGDIVTLGNGDLMMQVENVLYVIDQEHELQVLAYHVMGILIAEATSYDIRGNTVQRFAPDLGVMENRIKVMGSRRE